jgi:uncharacterized protein (TIGR03086 family)
MEGNEQLAVIIPMLKQVGDAIRPEQLAGKTPCASFDVSGVLEHMAGLASGFAPAFRGDPAPQGSASTDAGNPDLNTRFQAALDALLEAVHSPGALERTIETPFGPMPGATFARLVAFDGLIHGWDLATSTAQAWDPPENVIGEVDAFARQALTPELRDGDTFAVEQPVQPTATPMERLVAFSGRHV